MIKRVALALFAFVLLASIGALAEGYTMHQVYGTEVSIALPSDWYCADRVSDDDGLAPMMNMSVEEMREMMVENSMYAISVSQDFNYTLTIYVGYTEDDDYASLSDDVLNEYCKVFGDNVPSDEYKLIKAEVIGKENKFLKALYFGNTGRLTSYYLTVQNGKVYYITLVSKDTARQEQMDKVGDDIVCSIVLSSDTGYKRYVLSDPKMAIQFPSKYLVFWKNMSPNEDSLLVTGETVEYWNDLFSKNPEWKMSVETMDRDTRYGLNVIEDELVPNFKDVGANDLRKYLSVISMHSSNSKNYMFKYMITDLFSFVVSQHEFISNGKTYYQIVAYTYDMGKKIYLVYSDNKPISEETRNEFCHVLLSIEIEGKTQSLLEESEWLSEEDIATYPVSVSSVSFQLPRNFLYVTRTTPENDICLMEQSADIKALKNFMLGLQDCEMFAFSNSGDKLCYLAIKQDSIENDISLYNYDQLTSVLNNTMKLYNATEGMKTIDGSVFYGNTQIRFWIKIKFRNAATDDEMITYEVHFGSIDYVVTFEEKYISPEDEEIFDAIVRSIHVDN